MEGQNPIRITVVGVGGGGCNAVDRMIAVEIPGVNYVVLNTDGQALAHSEAENKILLGGPRSRGLGAGGDPTRGAEAARLSEAQITQALEGSDLVFIAAGMGGGTGSGAASVVADIAKRQGALSVAVVTKPFSFEGFRRCQVAEEATSELKKHVDTLIIVPNDKLLSFTSEKITLDVAFRVADDVLRQGIQGISEVITRPGLINVDFADVRRIMRDGGISLMAIAQARGPERAKEAALSAINSPLVDAESIDGATGILVNVIGGPDLSLHEAGQAVALITEHASPDCEVIFGAAIDDSMDDKLQITLIATGIGSQEEAHEDISIVERRNERIKSSGLAVLPDPDEFRQRLAEVRAQATATSSIARDSQAGASGGKAGIATGDSLDIPAFLRRVRNAL